MRPRQGVVVVVGNMLVELLVLLVGNVRLGARPQRIGLIDGFPFVFLDLLGLLAVPFFLEHLDGQGNMVGITAQPLAKLPAITKFVLVMAQIPRYRSAAIGFFDKTASAWCREGGCREGLSGVVA